MRNLIVEVILYGIIVLGLLAMLGIVKQDWTLNQLAGYLTVLITLVLIIVRRR
ncbi:hypothetical protein LCGC14_0431240 [marine sediment metagenome]|uniref:Uncharacterized protein n=1 Tax=marine sediment metagenome TaxID=412755 RepID=A0A0F9SU98_9ZZZZ